MAAVLRITMIAASAWFAILLPGRADAQSCLATEVAKEIIPKIGVPINAAQLLVLVLTPDWTADSSIDQITKLSPTFANRDANQLKAEDHALDKAQQFVRTMPSTEDADNCIRNMETMRNKIKKELSQRGAENIPEHLSPNQLGELRKAQTGQASKQKYSPNRVTSGDLGRPKGRPPTVVPLPVPLPLPGNCGPDVDCSMNIKR